MPRPPTNERRHQCINLRGRRRFYAHPVKVAPAPFTPAPHPTSSSSFVSPASVTVTNISHEYRLITTTPHTPGTCTASVAMTRQRMRRMCRALVGGAGHRRAHRRVDAAMTRDDARRGCRASETMGKHVLRARIRSTRARGVTRRGRRREAFIHPCISR